MQYCLKNQYRKFPLINFGNPYKCVCEVINTYVLTDRASNNDFIALLFYSLE